MKSTIESIDSKVNCKLLCEDIANLRSLGEEKFDTVVALDVLEHIEDDLNVLRAFNYVLKFGGRIIISVPAYPGFTVVEIN